MPQKPPLMAVATVAKSVIAEELLAELTAEIREGKHPTADAATAALMRKMKDDPSSKK